MSKKIGEQSLLKYEKLYNWGRTLITSGVIQNEDKFPSENILQKKFGYSRQTVRTALNQLEAEGLIKRVKGSGTYVSYEGNLRNGERPRIGLILSYFSDYLFPRVYDGIDSVMKEAGYDIDVAVTKNRLNDEAIYLEGLLNGNVAGFIIEGTRSFFPNPNIRLYEEIRKRNIPTLFIHNHYSNQRFDSVEMSDARAAYKLTEILIQNGQRSKVVHFELKGKELWDKAQNVFLSPVENLIYCDDIRLDAEYPVCGINALAHYTMLNPDREQMMMMTSKEYRAVKSADVMENPNIYDGNYIIEVWKYPVVSKMGDKSQWVDRLSLVLSLRDDDDPRVEKEVERIISEQKWKD